jgi:hypothetical protein
MEKLGPHTAAFRSIVHFDLYPLDRTSVRPGHRVYESRVD